MKHITTITDRQVWGGEDISHSPPRYTARAVLINPLGQIALLHSKEYDIYTIPGGGIEEGEDIKTALYREILEETGCRAERVEELGYIEENRGSLDYCQISYYFTAYTSDLDFNSRLTENEKKYGTTIDWYSPERAYEMIISDKYGNPANLSVKHKTRIGFLRMRDQAAFEEFLIKTK